MNDEKHIVTVDQDLEELIPGFLENRNKDIGLLLDALTVKNFSSMQSIGHSLKGVGGGYGFHKLSELGANIETAAKASDQASLEKLIGELKNYMENVEVVFEE